MSVAPAIVWFRQDLRLQDNPALNAALARRGPVIPVYILDSAGEGNRPVGPAARWWLHHSLAALGAALRDRGSRLTIARGDAAAVLRAMAATTGAGAVLWNRRYEPAAVRRDATIETGLKAAGLTVLGFNGSLHHEPHTIMNRQGRPFQVFTPFWRHCLALEVTAPMRLATGKIPAPNRWPQTVKLAALALLPRVNWAGEFAKSWQPGEAGAARRLRQFVARAMRDYADDRERPDRAGTSRLSPWLHFGEISPRQVWAAVKLRARHTGVFPPNRGAQVFLKEIGWREFAYHLLWHFPHTAERPLREKFRRFPWARDPGGAKLRAWQRGRTGYPIVDAGMRQLRQTGWMHNRARMIVASFLVKHLRLPWTRGAAWFWDTLVDADLANNTLGWQWSAGCGADAAPYFRIFSPMLQGGKFDPGGDYVRRWVPELARLDAPHIHAPWRAPDLVLVAAGVKLGENYPRPIVDHAMARAEALAALKAVRA